MIHFSSPRLSRQKQNITVMAFHILHRSITKLFIHCQKCFSMFHRKKYSKLNDKRHQIEEQPVTRKQRNFRKKKLQMFESRFLFLNIHFVAEHSKPAITRFNLIALGRMWVHPSLPKKHPKATRTASLSPIFIKPKSDTFSAMFTTRLVEISHFLTIFFHSTSRWVCTDSAFHISSCSIFIANGMKIGWGAGGKSW